VRFLHSLDVSPALADKFSAYLAALDLPAITGKR
jgi:hypothetical protein